MLLPAGTVEADLGSMYVDDRGLKRGVGEAGESLEPTAETSEARREDIARRLAAMGEKTKAAGARSARKAEGLLEEGGP